MNDTTIFEMLRNGIKAARGCGDIEANNVANTLLPVVTKISCKSQEDMREKAALVVYKGLSQKFHRDYLTTAIRNLPIKNERNQPFQ